MVKLWEALYGLLVNKVGVGQPSPANLVLEQRRSPDAQFDTININIGRTVLEIERLRARARPDLGNIELDSVDVQEYVR